MGLLKLLLENLGLEAFKNTILVMAGGLGTYLYICSKELENAIPFRAYQGKKSSEDDKHAPFIFERLALDIMIKRSENFFKFMNTRRSVRFFSTDPVPFAIVQNCIKTAGTAPSGAHCQPWHYCVIASPEKKALIRKEIEKQEQENYTRRMRQTWVNDLKDIVSDLHTTEEITKPYLEEAPYLIVAFKQKYGLGESGEKIDHYYVEESVGIANGLLISALHNANLATLTSTPMGAEGYIRELCGRPENERVVLLLPVGWPADNATVPYRNETSELRKSLGTLMSIV